MWSRKLPLSIATALLALSIFIPVFALHPAGAPAATTCVPPVDFRLGVFPSDFTLLPSSSASSTITVTPENGFTGSVNLEAKNVSPEITSPSFSVTAISITSGPGTSTLTFSISSTATPGSYSLEVNATTTGTFFLTRTIHVKVPAPEVGLTIDKFLMTVPQGGQDTTTITVASLYGFVGTVGLTVTISPILFVAPVPPTTTLSVNPVTLPNGQTKVSTLTISAGASATPGSYGVEIVGKDNASSATNSTGLFLEVTGNDFSLDVKPTTLKLPLGGGGTASVEVNSTGYTGPVNLSVSYYFAVGTTPTPTFGSSTVTLSSAGEHKSTTLAFDASSILAPSIFLANVSAVSGDTKLGHWTFVTIDVSGAAQPGYSISSSPTVLSVTRGASVSALINVKADTGFADTVNLSISCYPEEISATLSPGSVALTSGQTKQATLSVTASQYTTPGTYSVSIYGDSVTDHIYNFTDIVVDVTGQDFAIHASPSGLTISPGAYSTSTISYAGTNGFTGMVQLSATVIGPAGIHATLSPTSITSASTSTLTISVDNTVSPGVYGAGITGTSGSLSHTEPMVVTVTPPAPDFTISAPPTATVTAGSSGTATVTVAPLHGLNSAVDLTATVSPSSGLTVTFSPTIIPAGYTTATAAFAATATGTYTVTIKGTSGSLVHQTTVTVTVSAASDFAIHASPMTLSFTEGATATSTIGFTETGGFYNSIDLTATVSPSTGLLVTFNPMTSTYGAQDSTATFSSSTPRSYTVTITGTSGSIVHSVQVQVTVTPPGSPDFTISTSVSTLSIKQGNSGTSTINVSPAYGFTDTVNIAVTVLPSGPTVSVSSSMINYGSGSTILTVNVGGDVAPGSYTVTVTGTSGSLSHSTPIKITVQRSSQQTNNTSNNQTILGLQPNLFYVVVGVIVAALAAGVGVAVRMRKPKP